MKPPREIASDRSEPLETKSLVIAFQDIPLEGLDVVTEVQFSELIKPEEESIYKTADLMASFQDPIHIKAHVTPVGSKVDIKGIGSTEISGTCDRCTVPVKTSVMANLATFLMPRSQFSTHDKPGGKVIHGPTRESKASRHHSSSKAPVLTDAPDEHEDISFGAFDGQMLDLSPIIREQLILQIPMRSLCAESCKGLCLECGENINENKCRCKNGPTLVSPEDEGGEKKSLSPLAQALQKKILTR
jgi:uncharacterized protein